MHSLDVFHPAKTICPCMSYELVMLFPFLSPQLSHKALKGLGIFLVCKSLPNLGDDKNGPSKDQESKPNKAWQALYLSLYSMQPGLTSHTCFKSTTGSCVTRKEQEICQRPAERLATHVDPRKSSRKSSRLEVLCFFDLALFGSQMTGSIHPLDLFLHLRSP